MRSKVILKVLEWRENFLNAPLHKNACVKRMKMISVIVTAVDT